MMISINGFNGERHNSIDGTTQLGNGYRAYTPVLMRFICPDSVSPFGAGGINPYVYCMGDPANRADPGGHHSVLGWLGIIAGAALAAVLTPVSGGSSVAVALSTVAAFSAVASTGLEIMQQVVEEKDPKSGAILGWVALGTGIISALSSTTLSLLGSGVKSFASLLWGVSNRPFGSLMFGFPVTRLSVRSTAFPLTGRHVLSPRLMAMINIYERHAYAVSREVLDLPAEAIRGGRAWPQFGPYRRMIRGTIPVYSQELRDITPLHDRFERELNALYRQYNVPESTQQFSVVDEMLRNRAPQELPRTNPALAQLITEHAPELGAQAPPPAYHFEERPPDYAVTHNDDLLDYHHSTRL